MIEISPEQGLREAAATRYNRHDRFHSGECCTGCLRQGCYFEIWDDVVGCCCKAYPEMRRRERAEVGA